MFGRLVSRSEPPVEALTPIPIASPPNPVKPTPFVLPSPTQPAPAATKKASVRIEAPAVEPTRQQEEPDVSANEPAPVRVASAVEPYRSKPPAPLREWTDKSGKYKTMARLADLAGPTVYLQRSDRQIKAVPLDRLSVADQDFVRAEFPVYQLFGAVVGITDGDTFTILDADRTQHKIRLDGIDAPESKQDFGTQARKALGKKLIREIVRVDWLDRDRYDRILGDVFLADRWINREQVAEGWAWHFRKYSNSAVLAEAEKEARQAKLGMWERESPIPPWEYREPQSLPRAPPDGGVSFLSDGPVYETPATGSETVYITDSGTRYHRASCRYLKNGSIPIPLSDVQGIYTPCKLCHPELVHHRPKSEKKVATKRPRKSYNQSRTSSSSPTYIGGGGGSGTVHVRGYYRKDGTYVRPHTRKSPSR